MITQNRLLSGLLALQKLFPFNYLLQLETLPSPGFVFLAVQVLDNNANTSPSVGQLRASYFSPLGELIYFTTTLPPHPSTCMSFCSEIVLFNPLARYTCRSPPFCSLSSCTLPCIQSVGSFLKSGTGKVMNITLRNGLYNKQFISSSNSRLEGEKLLNQLASSFQLENWNLTSYKTLLYFKRDVLDQLQGMGTYCSQQFHATPVLAAQEKTQTCVQVSVPRAASRQSGQTAAKNSCQQLLQPQQLPSCSYVGE